jgi:hypothetical protein
MPVPDQASGEGARKVYEMLAKGNTALFLDVWPLHMFTRSSVCEGLSVVYPNECY